MPPGVPSVAQSPKSEPRRLPVPTATLVVGPPDKGPGARSASLTVPAGVPSVIHGSLPERPSSASKISLPPPPPKLCRFPFGRSL